MLRKGKKLMNISLSFHHAARFYYEKIKCFCRCQVILIFSKGIPLPIFSTVATSKLCKETSRIPETSGFRKAIQRGFGLIFYFVARGVLGLISYVAPPLPLFVPAHHGVQLLKVFPRYFHWKITLEIIYIYRHEALYGPNRLS